MRKKRPGVWRIFRVGGPRGHTPSETECTLVNVCQYNSETSYPKLQVYKEVNNIISADIGGYLGNLSALLANPSWKDPFALNPHKKRPILRASLHTCLFSPLRMFNAIHAKSVFQGLENAWESAGASSHSRPKSRSCVERPHILAGNRALEYSVSHGNRALAWSILAFSLKIALSRGASAHFFWRARSRLN